MHSHAHIIRHAGICDTVRNTTPPVQHCVTTTWLHVRQTCYTNHNTTSHNTQTQLVTWIHNVESHMSKHIIHYTISETWYNTPYTQYLSTPTLPRPIYEYNIHQGDNLEITLMTNFANYSWLLSYHKAILTSVNKITVVRLESILRFCNNTNIKTQYKT